MTAIETVQVQQLKRYREKCYSLLNFLVYGTQMNNYRQDMIINGKMARYFCGIFNDYIKNKL